MSSQNIVELNDSNFEESAGSGIVLIDFWAPWCGPCKAQTPILEELAEGVEESITIAKVNVDEAAATAAKFGVRSIPTIVILKDGQEVKRLVGLQQKQALLTELKAVS